MESQHRKQNPMNSQPTSLLSLDLSGISRSNAADLDELRALDDQLRKIQQEIEEDVTEESIIDGAGSSLISMMQDAYKEVGLVRNKEAVAQIAQIKVEGRKDLISSRISQMIVTTTPVDM